MTITTQAVKMLWGRAAARCSMTNCKKTLVLDETETDNPALIGEMAHMVAYSVDGPRGVSPLTLQERDHYDNLILLCRNHHREIDTQPETWPINRLEKLKIEHEEWVKQSLPEYDTQKQRDDEVFASYIDQWVQRSHLQQWQHCMQRLFIFGQPSLDEEVIHDLDGIPGWTIKRVWPEQYPTIIASLQNFALIARDLLNTFQEHAIKPYANATFHETKKFYKIDEWNKPRYSQLFKQFEYHVNLVQDLGLELTRAGNLVCDEVRANFLPTFFLEEGRLSVLSGPYEDMSWKQRVVQYSGSEKASTPPYPGLNEFLVYRTNRDWHYGEGLFSHD
ncbi:MAG: hypothetical protein HRU29_12000 [Rhizobiales bacterium]|nr:hypothetical protein [Hyphomicrobiales bacterium]NRB15111.1 hypothetical protein [Hyphomicrobiales bacterium]